jgi:hypothetical protein
VDLRVTQKRVALGRLIYDAYDFNKWLQAMNCCREKEWWSGISVRLSDEQWAQNAYAKSFSARQTAVAAILRHKAMLRSREGATVPIVQPSSFAA